MKVCDPVKRENTTCRPDGCSRFDCEKNNRKAKHKEDETQ